MINNLVDLPWLSIEHTPQQYHNGFNVFFVFSCSVFSTLICILQSSLFIYMNIYYSAGTCPSFFIKRTNNLLELRILAVHQNVVYCTPARAGFYMHTLNPLGFLIFSIESIGDLILITLFMTNQTTLPVNELTKSLRKIGYDVVPSDDAGRFVCNYVYYHSLRLAEQHGIKSLFVHVPLFLTIDEEVQMHFAASLLEVLASSSN